MTDVCLARENQDTILSWLVEKKLRPKHVRWLQENRGSSIARWDLFGTKEWSRRVNNKIKVAWATRDIIDALLEKKEAHKAWGEGYSMFYLKALAHFFLGISIIGKNKAQLIDKILERIKNHKPLFSAA